MAALGQEPPSLLRPISTPSKNTWVDRLAACECPAFTARRARRSELSGVDHDPIVWAEALGSNVVDTDGNRYVDLTAAFGVASIGHRHPAVLSAIQSQSLLHALGDLHPSDRKIELLERLSKLAPWDDAKIVLSLNGADAVTTALKTAAIATSKPGVLAFGGGYHGLSYGPLSVSGFDSKFRRPFSEQLNPHVSFVPWPSASDNAEDFFEVQNVDWTHIGAVIIEPVQARGGVRTLPQNFLSTLSAICRSNNAVLIADEIYCGLGRCGAIWQSEVEAAHVDLLCVGKSLGGGLPVSACIGRPEVMSAWASSEVAAIHTGTFFGNPLSAATALATLDVINAEQLCERSLEVGRSTAQKLRSRLGDNAKDVRGRGLLIGIELFEDGAALNAVQSLLEHGYLTLPAGSDARTIQLSPPLNIAETLLNEFVDVLANVIGG